MHRRRARAWSTARVPGRQPRRARRQGHAAALEGLPGPHRHGPGLGAPPTRTSGPRSGPRRPGCSEAVTRQARSTREVDADPDHDEVIASEQEMADAFVENRLLPGQVRRGPTSSPTSSTPSRTGEGRGRRRHEHQAALVPAHHGRRRSLVGGGHSVPRRRPPGGLRETRPRVPRADIDYLAHVARTAEQLGFEGVLTPDRHVVRGRLADHGRADPRDRRG